MDVFRTLGVRTPAEFYSLVVSNPTAREVAIERVVDDEVAPHELGFDKLGMLASWAQAEADAAGD